MLTLIYGKNSVLDAAASQLDLEVVYVARHVAAKFPSLVRGLPNVKIISSDELDALTKNANHQGFAARVKPFSYADFEVIKADKPPIILILDHIQDQQNLGAIIRSANALGVKHIIIPSDRAAEITPVTLKVASGGIAGVKVIRVSSLHHALVQLKKLTFWVYASALDETATAIDKVNFNYPVALVVGNEAAGVSKTLLNVADQVVYIPMKGTVQSLNVASATSILLYKLTTNK